MSEYSRLLAKATRQRLIASDRTGPPLCASCAVCKHASYSVLHQSGSHRRIHGQSFMVFCAKKLRSSLVLFGVAALHTSQYERMAFQAIEKIRMHAPMCEEVEPLESLEKQADAAYLTTETGVSDSYVGIFEKDKSFLAAVSANFPSSDNLMTEKTLLDERRQALRAKYSSRLFSFCFMTVAPIQTSLDISELNKTIRKEWARALKHAKNSGEDISGYYR